MIVPVILAFTLLVVEAHNFVDGSRIAQPKTLAADYLLPGNVVPSLYELAVEPNFDVDTYNGSVKITILVKSTMNTIILHANELDIDASSIRLLDESGEMANSVVGTSFTNNDKQHYSVIFENNLQKGSTYILVIGSFSGILSGKTNGFYLALYRNKDGEVSKLATTHFEPVSARKAFPCFDEPALKAQFEITIIRPGGYYSIANTPLISTKKMPDGRYQDKFERTVMMSTYLVAFIVTDFGYISDENQRVFGRPESIENGEADFALSTGIKVLNSMSKYVDIPYSLPKMDQIGIPNGYFAAGAMENWGLVTYREDFLLFYDEILCTEIIAHEFAHQWFGNLVTPSWWTYLWLNEGFATYFEYYASALVYEDIDFLYRMVTRSVQSALERESLSSSRPMNQEAGSPSDLSSLFDTIAYDKSGSVIRMCATVLSDDVFRRGLNIYLNNKHFGNAEPSDLYAAWQEALNEANLNLLPEGENVATVMRTWDSNAGYPLVTVIRNYKSNSLEISQRRFLVAEPTNDDVTIWFIPITYATKTNPVFTDVSPRVWLTSQNSSLSLDDLESSDWLVVNLQEVGYYRVNYDDENWYRIINALSKDINIIHKINRAQLFDDSFELAYAGILDYDIALSLVEYVRGETDYFALVSLTNKFKKLDTLLVDSGIYEKFKAFVLRKLEPALLSFGLYASEGDSYFTNLTRSNLLTWSCKYGSQICKQFALQRLVDWRENESKLVVSTLETPLNCAALRFGNLQDWWLVYNRYSREKDIAARRELLTALSCVQNVIAINKTLTMILDTKYNLTSSYRLQLVSEVYNSGSVGKNAAFGYIVNNWSQITNLFGETQLPSLLDKISFGLTTEEQLIRLTAVIPKNMSEILQRALEAVTMNIRWVNQQLPSILNWLNKRF